MIKVITIFGTRPEAIKMAPVVKMLQQFPEEIVTKVAVTAQHREMLDQVLRLFDIVPDYDLDIMQPNQTLFEITSRALLGLKGVLEEEKPDLVLVHGDTTTTFVGSLAAYYLGIKIGHVEAGLRTGNKYSPFPEEMNRKLTGALTDLHFAPTSIARGNLLKEGTPEGNIYITGNTVIDALLATVRNNYSFSDDFLGNYVFDGKRVLLVTTHRRENLGGPMANVYRALVELTVLYPDVEIIFPVHKNPKVRQIVQEVIGENPRIHLIEPMDYEPFINLINRSHIILTDSGGLQEEAPSLGKPVLVLRDTTERPEALTAGTVKLVGTDYETIMKETKELLDDSKAYEAMANAVNPYGDGQASRRIAGHILHCFGQREAKPDSFLD